MTSQELCIFPVCKAAPNGDKVVITQKGADRINSASLERGDSIVVTAGTKVHSICRLKYTNRKDIERCKHGRSSSAPAVKKSESILAAPYDDRKDCLFYGVTAEETLEGLNQAFNSACSQREKKKSGSGEGDGKPWEFETSKSVFKAVKDKRNTTSNLEETEDCLGDESSNSGILERATFESEISNTDGDDENNLPPSKPLKSISPKPSLKTTSSKRKGSVDGHDAARDGLYKLMRQHMEEKYKCPRLKFFESIMPQVDEMTDDCFLNFQIEVLNCLKCSRQHDPE